MKENLNLRLPRVSPDVLKLSAVNITELATPVGTAASGNRTADEESEFMARAFESYRTVLRRKVYMFFAVLGAYVLVVLTIIILVVKSRTATCQLR